MSDFTDGMKVADLTGEERQDRVEETMIKARLDGTIAKWELTNFNNISEEKKLVEKIVKDYERLINQGFEYDKENYQEQLNRLEKLDKKILEYSFRENDEDYLSKQYREEETINDDGEEK